MPLTPLFMLALFGLLAFLFILIQVDVLSFAFAKLGLSPRTGMLVLFGSLFGSAINVPLFTLPGRQGGLLRHRCHGGSITCSGTLGVLIGADLLHLPVIPRLGAPLALIGGAGTFDGIFFTGVLAALLA